MTDFAKTRRNRRACKFACGFFYENLLKFVQLETESLLIWTGNNIKDIKQCNGKETKITLGPTGL